ncbi:unnamed protein product [Rotaria sp. Silwood2]|nr:unnamed protein product [Rotaria sp. Silwood2]CAF2660868.1 unnamed protein product [Rotaria sp. Silwood2]CAF2896340.1 unnamed protein product [Rotaria sp. Silwood2]CAF3372587.1 unnamed protein product [Rotaria sp. Silwood2]CAF3897509.1 unnamed protein product [Rotaria sp. Silwood2]
MQTLHLDAFIVPAYTIHSSEVISHDNLVRNGKITLAELACWASHMQIWSAISTSESNDSWSLVLEDDINLEIFTSEVLQSFPRDLWNKPDLIYLGSCYNIPGSMIYEGAYGYRIHQALNPSCTHAYGIQSRAAAKLLRLLSSPRKAVDDEIVLLSNNQTLLVFSIHPPLALQRLVTTSNPSDVNPAKLSWLFQAKASVNYLLQKWRGVEVVSKLKDSALARANIIKAAEWREKNEHGIWKNENRTNSACTRC